MNNPYKNSSVEELLSDKRKIEERLESFDSEPDRWLSADIYRAALRNINEVLETRGTK